MENYRQYLVRSLLTLLTLLGLLGLFNLAVDPYGLFHLVDVKGFNQQKEGVRFDIRFTKALQLPLVAPETVLIGSSRVHDGIDPDHPLLQEYPPVYNLGVDLARIHEEVGLLNHAIANGNIKRVIFGIDFFMFDAAELTNPTYDASLIGRKIYPYDYLYQPFFSKEAFEASWRTLQISHATPDRKEFLPNGYRPADQTFYHLLDYPKLHYYTNSIFLSSDPSSTPYYGVFYTTEQVFQDFDTFLRTCQDHHIECILFITPAHATLDGEAVRAAGLWDTLENWKRRLVTIADRYHVPLWDFSGYNSITTEPVRTPMKYYWDSSHFTEVTTDLILTRLLDDAASPGKVPDDFGQVITPQNIEAHLAEIRQARAKYAAANPDEVNLIEQIYQNDLAGIPLTREQTTGIFDTH
jgi:hypothetical protein